MNEFAQSASSDGLAIRRVGVYLLGLATVAAGVLDMIWGDFDAGHQPIEALGNHIPGRAILAYITAAWMIAGGSALLWRRTARVGALATALIYFVFAMFSLPRFYTAPHILGFRFALFAGLVGQMLLQLIVVAGCLILYASFVQPASSWPQKSLVVARLIFGVGSVLFGLGHLTSGHQSVARMIPKWMPLGADFWVVISGIAFLLAGLAILSGILNVLAARLLALMLLIFEVALVPLVVTYSHRHPAWGANAYNLAAAGAVCIYAASITSRHAQREDKVKSPLAEVA